VEPDAPNDDAGIVDTGGGVGGEDLGNKVTTECGCELNRPQQVPTPGLVALVVAVLGLVVVRRR